MDGDLRILRRLCLSCWRTTTRATMCICAACQSEGILGAAPVLLRCSTDCVADAFPRDALAQPRRGRNFGLVVGGPVIRRKCRRMPEHHRSLRGLRSSGWAFARSVSLPIERASSFRRAAHQDTRSNSLKTGLGRPICVFSIVPLRLASILRGHLRFFYRSCFG